MKLELMWIISNISASIDMEENQYIIENLFYDFPEDLTKRKLSSTVELILNLFKVDSNEEQIEQAFICLGNILVDF